jgi:hypothetical protein
VKYASQIYVAVDQRYVATKDAGLLKKSFKPLSSMISNLIMYLRKSGMKGREIQKICVTQAFNLTKRSQTIEAADVG